jgi:phosphatidylinositol alpha-1,6-mannosyltransferase
MRRTCLFVSSHFPPPMIGGSLVFYRYLLSKCSDRDVLVLTQRKPDAEKFDRSVSYGVLRSRVVRDDTEPRLGRIGWFLLTVPWLLLEIARSHASVVHVGSWRMLVPTWLASRLSGRKLIITILGEELTTDSDAARGTLFRFMWRAYDRLAQRALRGADLVHTISRFTEKVLLERGVREDRIRVMFPGIDLEKGEGRGRVDAVLEARLAGRRVLLTIGRLQPRKGQDMVLRALPQLLADYPDLHYVIAGGADPRTEQEYQDLVDALGVGDSVTIVSNIDNESVAWLYDRCEVFIMANRTMPNGDTEGYGIVFIEAGSHGKPVIGGRAGGAVEAVDDGSTGILVDGNDVEDIGRAVRLLLDDQEMATRMGEAGRRKANDSTWASKALEYRGLIRDLAATRRTHGSRP